MGKWLKTSLQMLMWKNKIMGLKSFFSNLSNRRNRNGTWVEVSPPDVTITNEIASNLAMIDLMADSAVMGVDLYTMAISCFI